MSAIKHKTWHLLSLAAIFIFSALLFGYKSAKADFNYGLYYNLSQRTSNETLSDIAIENGSTTFTVGTQGGFYIFPDDKNAVAISDVTRITMADCAYGHTLAYIFGPANNCRSDVLLPVSYLPAGNYIFVAMPGFGNGDCNALTLSQCHALGDYEEASFSVSVSMSQLGQFKSDGITPIAEGGATGESTVILSATPQSILGNQLQLQAEVEHFDIGFTNQPNATSGFVNSGEPATTAVNLPGGSYHWRARVVDAQNNSNNSSNFREFGAAGNIDFEVDIPNSDFNYGVLYTLSQRTSDGTLSDIAVEQGNITFTVGQGGFYIFPDDQNAIAVSDNTGITMADCAYGHTLAYIFAPQNNCRSRTLVSPGILPAGNYVFVAVPGFTNGTDCNGLTLSQCQALGRYEEARFTVGPPVRDINVAVILAEPYGTPHSTATASQPCKLLDQSATYPGHTKAYFDDLLHCVKNYHLENSYGTVNFNFTVFDNGGNWYKTANSYGYYANGQEGQFISDATAAAISSGLNFSNYQAIAVVHSGPPTSIDTEKSYLMESFTIFSGSSTPPNVLVSESDPVGIWAHEAGHVEGILFTPSSTAVPDVYNMGTVDKWDLMANGARNADGTDPPQMSSYTKEFLQFLRYDIKPKSFYGFIDVNALTDKKIGDNIARYNLEDNTQDNDTTPYYVIEARNSSIGVWDTSIPQSALVLYRVNPLGFAKYGYFTPSRNNSSSFPANECRRIIIPATSTSNASGGVLASVGDSYADFDSLVKFTVTSKLPSTTTVEVHQIPFTDAIFSHVYYGAVMTAGNAFYKEYCTVYGPGGGIYAPSSSKAPTRDVPYKSVDIIPSSGPTKQLISLVNDAIKIAVSILLLVLLLLLWPLFVRKPEFLKKRVIRIFLVIIAIIISGILIFSILARQSYTTSFASISPSENGGVLAKGFGDNYADYSNWVRFTIAHVGTSTITADIEPITLSDFSLLGKFREVALSNKYGFDKLTCPFSGGAANDPPPILPTLPISDQKITSLEIPGKSGTSSASVDIRRGLIPNATKDGNEPGHYGYDYIATPTILTCASYWFFLLVIFSIKKIIKRKKINYDTNKLQDQQHRLLRPVTIKFFLFLIFTYLLGRYQAPLVWLVRGNIWYVTDRFSLYLANLVYDLFVWLTLASIAVDIFTKIKRNSFRIVGAVLFAILFLAVVASGFAERIIYPGVVLRSAPNNKTTMLKNKTSAPSFVLSVQPDLDLHAITPDGRHVGMNYATGQYENQIAGAIVSGDNQGSPEWILIPEGVEAKFYVSSKDNQDFLNQNPDIASKLTTTTDSYEIYSRYIDPQSGIFTSPTETNQTIAPAENVVYSISGTSTPAVSQGFVDNQPPTITHTSLSAEYVLNSAPVTFTFSADDGLGVGVSSTVATLDGQPLASGGQIGFALPGHHAIVITSSDFLDNTTNTTLAYNVIYNFGGFLPPMKADGSGLYNLGRTLPVKFQLTDANNAFAASAAAQLFTAKIQNDVTGTDEVALSVGGADTGNAFRYDSVDNQYIFNLDTGALTAGTWQLKAMLNDGTSHAVIISLKS